VPPDRGGGAEQIRHSGHRPEVQRQVAELLGDLALGGQQVVGVCRHLGES
jgi:hypothetical protein